MRTPFLILALLSCIASPLYSQANASTGLKIKAELKKKRSERMQRPEIRLLCPSVVVEGFPTKPVPAMEAKVVVITEQRDYGKKPSGNYDASDIDTVKIPAAPDGKKREYPFKEMLLLMEPPRSPGAGGGTVKWYILAVKDAATGAFLHFETDCPEVQKYVQARPELREHYYNLTPFKPFTLGEP